MLELLKQAVPHIRRVALLLKPDAGPGGAKDYVKSAEDAARALGGRLQVVHARRPEDFDRAFSDMIRSRAGAVVVPATPVFNSARSRLVDLAVKNRLPTMFSTSDFVHAGGLMSYGPDFRDLTRRAAIYVDKILKGARPDDLPINEQRGERARVDHDAVRSGARRLAANTAAMPRAMASAAVSGAVNAIGTREVDSGRR